MTATPYNFFSMGAHRVRGILLLAAFGGIAWWIHEKRPTVTGIVDTLTRPLFGSRAAVKGSERKRVLGEASQVITLDEERPVGEVRVGMAESEVRRLLGEPDLVETILEDDSLRERWTYRAADRVVVFERRRVVSITVR